MTKREIIRNDLKVLSAALIVTVALYGIAAVSPWETVAIAIREVAAGFAVFSAVAAAATGIDIIL